MKLQYAHTTEEEGLIVVGDLLVFMCVKPVTVQPSEVVKVQIGVRLQIEHGFALNISTHPALVAKLGEIFPAFIAVSASHDAQQLDIPVRNTGRNPIQIMVGDIVAQGHIVKVEPVDKEEADFEPAEVPGSRSKPQRKNPDFKFEMTN